MSDDRPTRSSLLHDISRKLQEYLPGQNWQNIEIKSIADLKKKYPGLQGIDTRSIKALESLLEELESAGAVAIMRWLTPIEEPVKPSKKRNPNPNTSGLLVRAASDGASDLQPISIMLGKDQVAFIDRLEGSRSMNVRLAIDWYQKFIESGHSSIPEFLESIGRGEVPVPKKSMAAPKPPGS